MRFRCAASCQHLARTATTDFSIRSTRFSWQATTTEANGLTKSLHAQLRKTSSIWKLWSRPTSATRSGSQEKSDGATISPSSATHCLRGACAMTLPWLAPIGTKLKLHAVRWSIAARQRSEEHTSELQSPDHLVCRLLLEKKK